MAGRTKRAWLDSWWLSACIAFMAITLEVWAVLWSSNFDFVLVILIAALALAILFILIFASKRPLKYVETAIVLCLISWILNHGSSEIRSELRWIVGATEFKKEVVEQADEADHSLKYVNWDGWGFAGEDTEVYLVFDPTDSLRKTGAGLPCKVWKIQRLERQWYAVTFYTDTSWDHCS